MKFRQLSLGYMMTLMGVGVASSTACTAGPSELSGETAPVADVPDDDKSEFFTDTAVVQNADGTTTTMTRRVSREERAALVAVLLEQQKLAAQGIRKIEQPLSVGSSFWPCNSNSLYLYSGNSFTGDSFCVHAADDANPDGGAGLGLNLGALPRRTTCSGTVTEYWYGYIWGGCYIFGGPTHFVRSYIAGQYGGALATDVWCYNPPPSGAPVPPRPNCATWYPWTSGNVATTANDGLCNYVHRGYAYLGSPPCGTF